MTTPYNPRTPINELHDMIDKQDDTIALQASIINEQQDDIKYLQRRVLDLEDTIGGLQK